MPWIGILRVREGEGGRRKPGNALEEEARDQGKRWLEVKTVAKNKVRWRSFVKALCCTLE
jgi:hypothetical protein